MNQTRLWAVLAMGALLLSLAACAEVSKTVPPEVSAAFKDGSKLYVLPSRLNLRQCPRTDCTILTVLNHGDIVLSTGDRRGWSKVETAAGDVRGWVATRYLGSDPNQPPPRSKGASEPPPLPKEQWGKPDGVPPPVKEQYGN
ncbi:MAG: SH3 domain-containing protein [Desulfarculaceae bacterium]|nr:SH3 domain-containing protein [Desulfarculaceae bacterium]MCF8072450.1 SH3 domain-containing protein [Desulfarculaceae bacterium]MCF8102911.1 SH3 domain-containing protein [Desulfarculaceae bacterium]MCF8117486.1 SH3 domain-containing protein [Desulfarculaceae bacterium]